MLLTSSQFLITCDHKKIAPGGTFVAIKGNKFDGAYFIPKAIENGAKRIVCERGFSPYSVEAKRSHRHLIGVSYEFVENTRKRMAELTAEAYCHPARKLSIVGITGTKGKTTTVWLINHLLRCSGKKTAMISSVENRILDESEPSTLTTPDSDYIQPFLAEAVSKNVGHVVMEVSAHALSQFRVHGIEFDCIGFTNLGHDHLDYYKNLEEYFEAKCLLIKQLKKNGTAVINFDDAYGRKFASIVEENKIRVNRDGQATSNFHCPSLPGEFNRYNILMATCVAKSLGLEEQTIENGLKTFQSPPGRMQKFNLKSGATAFVDFAHNPSSMKEILKTLKQPGKKLITIFGCGGERDKEKRPLMGKIAEKYSDLVFVTDDNPRNENPKKIVSEIVSGFSKDFLKKNVHIEHGRSKAIEEAIRLAPSNSIIAILGKGAEKFQIVGDKKISYSDLDEIRKHSHTLL